MVHLVSVHDEFHARVITARLGSDGIVIEVRPPLGGPYPLIGEVHLYVGEEEVQLARALLRADEDQSGLDNGADDRSGDDVGAWLRPFLGVPLRVALAVMMTAAILLLALTRAG
jgi:hypothetical protein